jgi:hypothetical protein
VKAASAPSTPEEVSSLGLVTVSTSPSTRGLLLHELSAATPTGRKVMRVKIRRVFMGPSKEEMNPLDG